MNRPYLGDGLLICGLVIKPCTMVPEWLGHLDVLRKPESLQTRRDLFAEDRHPGNILLALARSQEALQ